jgi:ABC-2 type transport system permease protein
VRRAVRAEWAKTWSDPGTAWLLAGLVVLTVLVSVVTEAASHCQAAGCGQDPARISLAGVYLGQAVAALAGVLAVGGEFGTGMIRVSLAAVPRRGRLLSAKALVLAGTVLPASALAVGACALAGLLTLGRSLTGFAMLRASCCAVLYLTLVALLALGVTAVVREAAAAIGTALGLLFLFPVAASLAIGHASIQRRLQQIGPMTAGLDSMSTTGLRALALTPWQGLGVVALWAAGALLLGGLVFGRRDA